MVSSELKIHSQYMCVYIYMHIRIFLKIFLFIYIHILRSIHTRNPKMLRIIKIQNDYMYEIYQTLFIYKSKFLLAKKNNPLFNFNKEINTYMIKYKSTLFC
jgi:hypothetical protein